MNRYVVALFVVLVLIVAGCQTLPYTVDGTQIQGKLEIKPAVPQTQVTYTGYVYGPSNAQFKVWMQGLDDAGFVRYEQLDCDLESFSAEENGITSVVCSTQLRMPPKEQYPIIKVWLTQGSESPDYSASVLDEASAK